MGDVNPFLVITAAVVTLIVIFLAWYCHEPTQHLRSNQPYLQVFRPPVQAPHGGGGQQRNVVANFGDFLTHTNWSVDFIAVDGSSERRWWDTDGL